MQFNLQEAKEILKPSIAVAIAVIVYWEVFGFIALGSMFYGAFGSISYILSFVLTFAVILGPAFYYGKTKSVGKGFWVLIATVLLTQAVYLLYIMVKMYFFSPSVGF